jgi:hypothetical protein
MLVALRMVVLAQVLARGARAGRSESAVSPLLCTVVLSCCWWCCCLPVALSLRMLAVLGGVLLFVAALLVRSAQPSAVIPLR